MGHGHHHSHHHGPTGSGRHALGVALALNAVFMVIEFAGGYWTNSVAIITDAVHDLGDTVALGFAFVMQRVALRRRDRNYSYGYGRFSLLSALASGSILLVGSAFVLYEAIPRFWKPEAVYAPGMMGLAVLGLLFNGIAALVLHGRSSLNERAVSWHLFEDVLGWAAVLVGAIIMFFVELPWIDPLLSVLISLFVLYNAFRLVFSTVRVFLQAVPESVSVEAIESQVLSRQDVLSTHDTHIWTLDGEFNVLTMHVVVSDHATVESMRDIKCHVRTISRQNNVQHATVEVEKQSEECELNEC